MTSNFAALCLVLFTFVTGCSRYDLVNCTPEEAEYIESSLFWMKQNQTAIQGNMSMQWPDHQASLAQILNALNTVPIECGLGHHDDTVAATHRTLPKEKIIIDVSHPLFVDGLANYLATRYVMESSIEELADPMITDFNQYDTAHDFMTYHVSLADLALSLTHEGAHLVLGGHTKEAKNKLDELKALGVELGTEVTGLLDEIHGWGAAAFNSSRTVYLPDYQILSNARTTWLTAKPNN